MIDLPTVRWLAAAALENVERHRGRINALNVYPVPDGDTGTNLQKTMEGIVAELDRSEAATTAQLAADVQRAATMEAKGNSGVILSTIVRGMARVLGEGDQVDGDVMAEAFRAGTTSAYHAVKLPVEGTMLTVIREMAEEAELRDVRALPVVEGLTRVVARGDDAVRRTPEMLDKLREAGVVDAGGAGLVELVRGVLHALTGEPLPDVPEVTEEISGGVDPPRGVRVPVLHGVRRRGRGDSTWTRCTQASSRSVTRCSSRGTRRSRRCTSTPTSPRARSTADGRSGSSTPRASRSATCTARPRSASAGSRSSTPPRRRRRARWRSSRSRRGAATATSSAARARRS